MHIYKSINTVRIKKKLYPLKFKLSASYCINLTSLTLRINDPQKHKVLYKWELYDFIINFKCVQDLLLLRTINSKQSELSN